MRDVDDPPDEHYPAVKPNNLEEQKLYVQKFRGRYADELAALVPPLDPSAVEQRVCEVLQLCPPLIIRHPRDVLRFLRLMILVRPQLQRSAFFDQVVHRILTATEDWSATKRLDFIDTHIIDRPLPETEPNFGPWWNGSVLSLVPSTEANGAR